ncbi:MAG: DUF401 family protein [Chitinivibrionales bacterium]|nr:DUF401 family protein [Chitinivibrionales bacterium]
MPDWLFLTPAVVKIISIFLCILALYRLEVPLGLAMLLCSVMLAFWAGSGLQGVAYIAHAYLQPDNYLMILLMLLLMLFIESLSQTGRMQRTVDALQSWFKNRSLLLAGLPALVGLLPMPGGALFSAPFVASTDDRNQYGSSHKVAINYLFRHVWEHWWPLYPGVILALRYVQIPLWMFVAIQFPLSIVSIASGYFFLLRKVGGNGEMKGKHGSARAVAQTLGPVAIVVLCGIAGGHILSLLGIAGKVAGLLAIITGLCLALASVYITDIGALKIAGQVYTRKKSWMLILVILGVLAFSSALGQPVNGDGETLVSIMRDEFMAWGIPIVVVIILLPFISGIVTGIAIGYVGASFPLVFALLGESPSLNLLAATTTLAFGFGYVGMILSPVHICFVVTNEYFKSRLYKTYPYLLGPLSITALAICLLGWGYYRWFPR